jgi:hypothetical protein
MRGKRLALRDLEVLGIDRLASKRGTQMVDSPSRASTDGTGLALAFWYTIRDLANQTESGNGTPDNAARLRITNGSHGLEALVHCAGGMSTRQV